MSPKILNLDIETSPILAHVWGLKNQFINLNQIIEDPRMIGFGAMWDHSDEVLFFSEYAHGRDAMIYQAEKLLSEADAVVYYNGDNFDEPWINAEMVVDGLTPSAPFKKIDLFKVVRKNFRFPSYKLDYVAYRLLNDRKVKHAGHQMWVDCLMGDKEAKAQAWADMETYCKQDVRLLKPLRQKLTPWMGNTMNTALWGEWDGEMRCTKPVCESANLEKRGYAYTGQGVFQQYRCRDCGGWSRDTKALHRVQLTGVAR